MKKIICIALAIVMPAIGFAQSDNEKQWGIQIGVGGFSSAETTPDGQAEYFGDDDINDIFISADYYIRKHLALTGSIYFDNIGMLGNCVSSGIGLKKIGNAGFSVGAKYYFLPTRWVVQPFVGASLKTNFLNLGNMRENAVHDTPNSQLIRVNYEAQCPALRIVPRIGVDVRIFSSVSLCADYQAGYGFWGYNRQTVAHLNGSMAGVSSLHETSRWQTGFSIGLKMDFPVREVSSKERNNFLKYLFYFLYSR